MLFSYEAKLQTSKRDEYILDKRFFYANNIKNKLVKHCQHCLNKLRYNKEYHFARQAYHEAKEKGDVKTKAAASAILNTKIKEVGLTKSELEKYSKLARRDFEKSIDANTAQVIAAEVYAGVSAVLFGGGQKLHFHKALDTLSVRSKTNKQGIRYRKGQLIWNNLTISIAFPKRRKDGSRDPYMQAMLDGCVKYCRIVRRMIGARWHYYVQFVVDGEIPIKHMPGEGTVGIDNGTSVFAVVSDSEVAFEPLGAKTADIDAKIEEVQQAFDRSMRTINPDNYDENGVPKKGRQKWNYSRRCRILRRRLKGLHRRKAARNKQQEEVIANRILAKGKRFITEPVKLKALAKRAKKTTINKKTGRPNKKKRFGKSIARHAPGAVIATLDRKLHYFGLRVEKVELETYRASQFNHQSGEYKKKTLDQRWVEIGGEWVQRDLYSGFLLKHPDPKLQNIDQAACIADYQNFKKQHDMYIDSLMNDDIKLPACCGIHCKKAA